MNMIEFRIALKFAFLNNELVLAWCLPELAMVCAVVCGVMRYHVIWNVMLGVSECAVFAKWSIEAHL